MKQSVIRDNRYGKPASGTLMVTTYATLTPFPMTTSSSLKTAKHIPQLLCDKILKRQTGTDRCKMNDGTRMTLESAI